MKWRMFYIPVGDSTRNDTSCFRLHHMEDHASSVGFVEQTQGTHPGGIWEEVKFHVHMNTDADYLANPNGIEVPDLEAGMALVKILYNPSNR